MATFVLGVDLISLHTGLHKHTELRQAAEMTQSLVKVRETAGNFPSRKTVKKREADPTKRKLKVMKRMRSTNAAANIQSFRISSSTSAFSRSSAALQSLVSIGSQKIRVIVVVRSWSLRLFAVLVVIFQHLLQSHALALQYMSRLVTQ